MIVTTKYFQKTNASITWFTIYPTFSSYFFLQQPTLLDNNIKGQNNLYKLEYFIYYHHAILLVRWISLSIVYTIIRKLISIINCIHLPRFSIALAAVLTSFLVFMTSSSTSAPISSLSTQPLNYLNTTRRKGMSGRLKVHQHFLPLPARTCK